MAAHQTYEEKIRSYIKVAMVLAVITVVEVGLTFVPHDEQPMKLIITTLIVALSCSKAFFVAYYYMHLNHEKLWTKIVAASPLCILIYVAALLGSDIPHRPMHMSEYIGQPARTQVEKKAESTQEPKAEAAPVAADSQAAAPGAEGGEAAPAAPSDAGASGNAWE